MHTCMYSVIGYIGSYYLTHPEILFLVPALLLLVKSNVELRITSMFVLLNSTPARSGGRDVQGWGTSLSLSLSSSSDPRDSVSQVTKTISVHLFSRKKKRMLERWLSGDEHWQLLGLFLSTHMVPHSYLYPSSRSSAILASMDTRHTHGKQTYMQTRYPYT